jgi:hypothetical protein
MLLLHLRNLAGSGFILLILLSACIRIKLRICEILSESTKNLTQILGVYFVFDILNFYFMTELWKFYPPSIWHIVM